MNHRVFTWKQKSHEGVIPDTVFISFLYYRGFNKHYNNICFEVTEFKMSTNTTPSPCRNQLEDHEMTRQVPSHVAQES